MKLDRVSDQVLKHMSQLRAVHHHGREGVVGDCCITIVNRYFQVRDCMLKESFAIRRRINRSEQLQRIQKEKKIPEVFRAIYTLLMPNDCIRISGLAVPLAIVFLLLRSFTVISAGANIAPSTLKKSKPAALNVSKNGFP